MTVCTKCKQDKPDTDFRYEPSKKNKLSSHCKECRFAYTKVYYKKYYQEKKEKCDAAHKAYMKRKSEEKYQDKSEV
jgi:hypothetical protein